MKSCTILFLLIVALCAIQSCTSGFIESPCKINKLYWRGNMADFFNKKNTIGGGALDALDC